MMATFNMMDLKEGDSWEIPGPKSAEETYGTNKYSKRCMVGALLVTIVCVAVVAGVVAYVTMSSSSLGEYHLVYHNARTHTHTHTHTQYIFLHLPHAHAYTHIPPSGQVPFTI